MPGSQPENHGFDIQGVCCPGPDICLTFTPLTPRPHRWSLWEQAQPSTSSPEHLKHRQRGFLQPTPAHSQGHGPSRTVIPTASQEASHPRQGCSSAPRGRRKGVKRPGIPPDEGTDAWQVSTQLSGSGQGKGGLSKCSNLHHLCPHTSQPI